MKDGTFIITNYAMGRAISSVTLEGSLKEAVKRGETMEPLGLPGTGKGAAAKSRIIGIKRMES